MHMCKYIMYICMCEYTHVCLIPMNNPPPPPPPTGVSNGDDLQYLFNGTTFAPLRNLDDRRLSDLIVLMWTNFAATG